MKSETWTKNYQQDSLTMIEERDYKLPHKEVAHEPTDEERQQAAETLAYLEALPFRPIGVEW